MGIIFGVFSFFLTACQKTKPGQHNELRIQLSADPVSLVPALAEDGNSLRILHLLMRGLTAYNGQGELVNAIAERIEANKNSTKFNVHLKPNALWSNGQPVLASDFIRGFKQVLDPNMPAKLVDSLFFIKNAKAYKLGQIKNYSHVGIRAVNEQELEFVLESPCSFFSHVLSLAVSFPLPAIQARLTKQDLPYVTTGDYVLVEHKPDKELLLSRNDISHAKNNRSSSPERIKFLIIPEEVTALDLLQSGYLDVATRVPQSEMPKLLGQGIVRTFPFNATYYIGFNHNKSPWNDVKNRRLLSQSIDRIALTKLLNSEVKPIHTWFSELSESPNPIVNKVVNNTYLTISPLSQTLSYDGGGRNQLILERIQEELKQKIGLKLKLMPRDWKSHLRGVTSKDSPLFRFGWLTPFLDDYARLILFTSDNPNNHTGWKNLEFDSLVKQLSEEIQPQARRIIAEKAAKILDDQAVVVPLYSYQQSYVLSKRVSRFNVNVLGHFDPENISFNP